MGGGGGFEYKKHISTHRAFFQIEEAPAQNRFPTQFAGEKNSPAFFSALAEMN